MSSEQLEAYLASHPDYRMCPDCGGAGERIFPVGCKVIECFTCKGAGVVKKEAVCGR